MQRFFPQTDFIEERKEKTIESMVASFLKFASIAGFIFYELSLFIEDWTTLFAGVGIIGVVVGFGAQSLIKDVVSGIFFLYEKQLHKGDFIRINVANIQVPLKKSDFVP